ncbi:glucosidase II beta subunit-like protein, partial [Trifolium medium]|nr:glucosidase II beta subunit-like protein [Trifolium medium]
MYGNYNSKASDQGIFAGKEATDEAKSEESVYNLNGFMLVMVL